jgi:FKBP-type peptidyl-prolyl cis-trans isomerase (trigger factor)
MVGMMPSKEKELQVKFPEPTNKNPQGKDATFKVKLHEFKEAFFLNL